MPNDKMIQTVIETTENEACIWNGETPTPSVPRGWDMVEAGFEQE